MNKQRLCSILTAIALSLSLICPLAVMPASAAEASFTDVDTSDWFYPYVSQLAEADGIHGYPDGSFKPNNNISRAEAAAIAVNLFAADQYIEDNYEADAINETVERVRDGVGEGHWAEDAIAKAILCNVKIEPEPGVWDQPATRADVAHIMVEIYIAAMSGQGKLELPITMPGETVWLIGDYDEIEGTAEALDICWLYCEGVVSGINDQGDFNPKGCATRAECSKIAVNMLDPDMRLEIDWDNLQPGGKSDSTSDNDSETPDNDSESPDNDSESSDNDSESPDNDSESPDNDSESPDNDSESPDNDSESSDNDSESSDNDSESPDSGSDSIPDGTSGSGADGTPDNNPRNSSGGRYVYEKDFTGADRVRFEEDVAFDYCRDLEEQIGIQIFYNPGEWTEKQGGLFSYTDLTNAARKNGLGIYYGNVLEELKKMKSAYDLYPDGFLKEMAEKKGSRRTEIILSPYTFDERLSHGMYLHDESSNAEKVDQVYYSGVGNSQYYSHEMGNMIISAAAMLNDYADTCDAWSTLGGGGMDNYISTNAMASTQEDWAETWAYLWHQPQVVASKCSSAGVQTKVQYLTDILDQYYSTFQASQVPWASVLEQKPV